MTVIEVAIFSLLSIALTVHEFSHALAADKLGDPTAKMMGRLSLNRGAPRSYRDTHDSLHRFRLRNPFLSILYTSKARGVIQPLSLSPARFLTSSRL